MQELGIERTQLLDIEARRRTRQFPEGEVRHELVEARMRRDRVGGADGRGVARHGERLEPLLAHALNGERPVALGQRLTLGADQQIVMAEGRRLGAQRLEQLDLRRGIGDVILAADHMGDAEVDVVDHARQRVEIGAVGADQHRVGQRGGVDMLLAAHEIVPHHVAGLEQEAPMGLATLRLELGPIGLGELQRGAVIDRRPPARELALALELQLLLRLVGRIEPAARLQLLDRVGVEREALGLLDLAVPGEPEPGEILADALRRSLPSIARRRCRRAERQSGRRAAARTSN